MQENFSNSSHQMIELIKRNTTKLISHFFIFLHFSRIYQSSLEKERKRKDLVAERTLESLKEMQSGPWPWLEGRRWVDRPISATVIAGGEGKVVKKLQCTMAYLLACSGGTGSGCWSSSTENRVRRRRSTVMVALR